MTSNPTAADQVQATIVDRIPTWATSVQLEPDGYVLFSRVVREDVEIQQSSHLAVDEEAGTVSYRAVDGLQLWLPDIENSISPEKARTLLVDLQELLAVVDEIEAGQRRPGTTRRTSLHPGPLAVLRHFTQQGLEDVADQLGDDRGV